MGKNEFLTPKAIDKRNKEKRPQKQKWYRQMCGKQCRDENGFKCHCMSESHLSQMQYFGENPDQIIEDYSGKFEKSFLEHMKRVHRFSRAAATLVYNEYIRDRYNTHLNSTRWLTLTQFVKYLGRTGKCKVEETPKGLFITYIDRDSETALKERKKKNKRTKADMAEEEKQEKEIMKQIEKADQLMQPSTIGSDQPLHARELKVEDGVKIRLSLGSSAKPITKGKPEGPNVVLDEERNPGGSLNELMQEEEKKKDKINRKDY